MKNKAILSNLPSVDELLRSQRGEEWLQLYPRVYVLKAIRETIDEKRKAILSSKDVSINQDDLLNDAENKLIKLCSFSLKPVINATGVVIHTNLGRSILTDAIMEHVKQVSTSYSTLEYDLDKGKRGKRYSHVQRLLRDITGAEDALVVNNNAGAVFMCLRELAKGKEVVVSRGELVEIGGSFRVPDVMAESGAILREVGTTNKTHLHDYEKAINENTALLLKVHQSNFRTIGFVKLVEIDELVALGKKYNLPVMFDLGSGCLIDLTPYGIHIEPTVQRIIQSGCDIVTFSGDKLLGGPQGGVIAGKKALIERISRNPLMRALRVDKMTLSAFEAVLMKYLDLDVAKQSIPTLKMILQPLEEIKERAITIEKCIKETLSDNLVDSSVMQDDSQAGGGSLPEVSLKTFVVRLIPKRITLNALENRLRIGNPPVISRIKDDALVLDARTIQDREIPVLVEKVVEGIKNEP
ncbi:MAG: L-seryl-tRNA(Sec) selenium transferase [Thermodesulfovibrionales bacterium]|nr:L-seryl-tRNA(Sec) selenium transferase [Thermodesulfovibrionales bacterium]